MTVVPPLKSQGIKTKLVDWIADCAKEATYDRWIEPFCGTAVVAFNIRPKAALLCDSNPHIIRFYKAVQSGEITSQKVRLYLQHEGDNLHKSGGEHYYIVRERFNRHSDPFDFLFLNRSCFNGMMRFNRKGFFNVPFCKKPERFARALVTKICNQIDAVGHIIATGDYCFINADFRDSLQDVTNRCLIYCDPPYIGRHVDYFDSWSEEDESALRRILHRGPAKFMLSTWIQNRYRTNHHVYTTWQDCFATTRQHFYHVGAREQNRNAITEALLSNFRTPTATGIEEIITDDQTQIHQNFRREPIQSYLPLS